MNSGTVLVGTDGFTWVYLHGERHTRDACDGPDVADQIEIEFVIEGRVDRMLITDQQERVAVSRCTYNRFALPARLLLAGEWITASGGRGKGGECSRSRFSG